MTQAVHSIPSFVLQSRWIPGTMDRVFLSKEGEESLELSIQLVWQVFGKEPVDHLYLQGKAELDCDAHLWAMLVAGAARSKTLGGSARC